MRIDPLGPVGRWLGWPPATAARKPSAVLAPDRTQLSPEAIRAGSKRPDTLGGAFIQFGGDDKPPEYWAAELSHMQSVGMDTVVIQYTRYDDTAFPRSTEAVLTAADRLGMKVLVGTALEERTGSAGNWYLRQFVPGALTKQSRSAAADAADLVKRLGGHPSLAGIYIPYEVNGLANARAVGDFYGAIARAVKNERPDLKVMVSPYTNVIPGLAISPPRGYLTRWWDTVLSRAPIDIVAWQDGVGGTATQLKRVEHDLGALADAGARHGTEIWADLEAFHRTTPWYKGFAAEATSSEMLERQIQASGRLAGKLVVFDFNHYLSPQAGDGAAKLFEDYRKYLEERSPPTLGR